MSAHCEAMVVDCDIDVIDRSQFPAAPGARPGGMAVHDFFAAVRRLAAEPRVRVIDLTEWDPPLDATRPQRFDRGALGRRVPCRVRDALALGVRCGGSGATITSLGAILPHAFPGNAPAVLLRCEPLDEAAGAARQRDYSPAFHCTSCTRPSVSPSRVFDFGIAEIAQPHHRAPFRGIHARALVLDLVEAELFGLRLELHDAVDLRDLIRGDARHPLAGDPAYQPVHPGWHSAVVGARADQQRLDPQLLASRAVELDIVDDPARALVLVDDRQVEQLADELEVIERRSSLPSRRQQVERDCRDGRGGDDHEKQPAEALWPATCSHVRACSSCRSREGSAANRSTAER